MEPHTEKEYTYKEAIEYARERGFVRELIWWRKMFYAGKLKGRVMEWHGSRRTMFAQSELDRIILEKPTLKVVITSIGILFALIMSCASAFALPDQMAIKTVMGEARGEGYKGMLAVAEVLRRRDSVKGFYGFKAKFNEPKWVWDLARKAWNDSLKTNTTNGATHFESTDFKKPTWAKKMKVVAHVGKHVFYK